MHIEAVEIMEGGKLMIQEKKEGILITLVFSVN